MIRRVRKNKHLLFIGLFSILTLLSYVWFSKTTYFESFAVWTQNNLLLFVVTLWIIKFVGVIWPPIPGGLLTLGAIPIIGWVGAYLIDMTASTAGSVVAFYLGKRYGYAVLERLFDASTIRRIQSYKVKEKREIEAVVIMRVLFGTTIVEAVSYAAGIMNIGFWNFLVGAVISHIVVAVPMFYFAASLFGGNNVIFNLIVIAIVLPIVWKLRNRYFEKGKEVKE